MWSARACPRANRQLRVDPPGPAPQITPNARGKCCMMINGLEGFDALGEACWDACAAPDQAPTQSWIWAKSAAEIFGKHAPIRLLHAGDPSAPTALAAFYQARRGYRAWHRVGGTDLGKCPDIGVQNAAAAHEMAAAILALPGPVDLGHHPADCPVLHAITQARGSKPVLRRARAEQDTPWVELQNLPEDPLAALSASRRKSLRAGRRKIEAARGPFRLRVLCPTVEALPPLLDAAFAVEASGWKGRAGTAMAVDTSQGDFYRLFCHRAAARGRLRLCFLDIGDQPAAMHISVEAANALWLIKTGFDERFSAASPGVQLDMMVLGEARARGVSRVMFVGKEEPWLGSWMQGARPLVAARLVPISLRGAQLVTVEAARALRRRFG